MQPGNAGTIGAFLGQLRASRTHGRPKYAVTALTASPDCCNNQSLGIPAAESIQAMVVPVSPAPDAPDSRTLRKAPDPRSQAVDNDVTGI